MKKKRWPTPYGKIAGRKKERWREQEVRLSEFHKEIECERPELIPLADLREINRKRNYTMQRAELFFFCYKILKMKVCFLASFFNLDYSNVHRYILSYRKNLENPKPNSTIRPNPYVQFFYSNPKKEENNAEPLASDKPRTKRNNRQA